MNQAVAAVVGLGPGDPDLSLFLSDSDGSATTIDAPLQRRDKRHGLASPPGPIPLGVELDI